MNFQVHRPQGYTGVGDKSLPKIIRELEHKLIEAQDFFAYETLYLTNNKLEELACILVEFIEDIHNDIGIWKSYEKYNFEFFKTPLPFTLQPNAEIEEKEWIRYRIHQLLYILYPELKPGLILSPRHKDLIFLADYIFKFLEQQFSQIPQGSGIKTFLSQTNKYGWDVKRKLIWLGQHSYFFRHNFQNYVIKEHGGKMEIPIIDDFICQENTCWSGLGVIDILAAVLDINESRRQDLRSWYEKHTAYYKVMAVKGPIIEMMNIINDKPYRVRVGWDNSSRFKVQQIVFGSLVPWNMECYWSGNQMVYNDVNKENIMELKNTFLQKAPKIAYRYCDQLAKKAKERVKVHYDEFVKYHGDDLVTYPDGLSMAADWQKRYRLQYESQPKEILSKVMERHKLSHPWPTMSIPEKLIESKNGIGIYFNQDEGQEIMQEFNVLISGFKKKGINLNEDEEEVIRGFICSYSVSPVFVRKLVQRYGDESIASAFYIDRKQHEYYLDYLFRRYKGHFFRKRYPEISFV